MKDKKHSHGPRPPAMFMNSAIIAPFPDRARWKNQWSFRRPLSIKHFLQIDPFSLSFRQQRHSSFGPEVSYNNTASPQFNHECTHFDTEKSTIPDKKSQDHYTTQKVINE
jgi:hypothetical protein